MCLAMMERGCHQEPQGRCSLRAERSVQRDRGVVGRWPGERVTCAGSSRPSDPQGQVGDCCSVPDFPAQSELDSSQQLGCGERGPVSMRSGGNEVGSAADRSQRRCR